MTEIELARPAAPAPFVAGTTGGNLIREAAAVMVDAHALAVAIANTQMVPKHFQGKPDECAAAMLYGASLGLDPMQSVRQIYVVHGQAALYARAMSALTMGAGHQIWTVKSVPESVTVAGSRAGSPHVETITWTYDRAHKAGYTSNAKYKTDPEAMLYAKALSEVCRKIAPDVLSGVYSVEEMQMERTVDIRTERIPARGALSAALAPEVAEALIPTPAESAESAEQIVNALADATTDAEVREWGNRAHALGLLDAQVHGQVVRDHVTERLAVIAQEAPDA